MILLPSEIRSAFSRRGVRVASPVSHENLTKVSELYQIPYDCYLFSIYSQMDGFDDDFDKFSFISLWSVKTIIGNYHIYRDRNLIPFADFSFSSDVYCLGTSDVNGFLWSNLKGDWTHLSISKFFQTWLEGAFDHEVGVPLA